MSELSMEQKARAERQRQRAAALKAAKAMSAAVAPLADQMPQAMSAGGFLPEPTPPPGPPKLSKHPLPLHAHERPACEECGQRFSHSYLHTEFQCNVCDECRDSEGAHGLVTRTEAKSEFLLTDCDLDQRGGELPCQRRPNPHRGGKDMRLYLRKQIEERALAVWGSEEALEAERVRREEKRVISKANRGAKRLRALRMDVRSSLYKRDTSHHIHQWGPETAVEEDTYKHTCSECGLTQTYEKM